MRGLLVKDFRQLMQQKKSLIMIVVLALILNLKKLMFTLKVKVET